MQGARPGLSATQEVVGRIKILPRPALPEQGIQHSHWRVNGNRKLTSWRQVKIDRGSSCPMNIIPQCRRSPRWMTSFGTHPGLGSPRPG